VEAIDIRRLRRASARGGAPQRYGWRAAEPDVEEVRACHGDGDRTS
jgi:hypothetical protein